MLDVAIGTRLENQEIRAGSRDLLLRNENMGSHALHEKPMRNGANDFLFKTNEVARLVARRSWVSHNLPSQKESKKGIRKKKKKERLEKGDSRCPFMSHP